MRDEDYAGEGFPLRIKIEVSDQPDFHNSRASVDHTAADYPHAKGAIQQFRGEGAAGRYLRLTAARLMNVAGRTSLAHPTGGYYLALGKIGVYSGGKEVSAERPVTVDPAYGNYDDVAQVTRAERAGGEGVFMNNPGNVTQANTWKPPVYKARKPLSGVSLNGGVFQTAMENNIAVDAPTGIGRM